MEQKLEKLFENLCCGYCRHSFNSDSFHVLRRDDNYLAANFSCKYCGNDYGITLVGYSELELKDSPAVNKTREPINYDDVIEAHRFIKDLKGDWNKYLPL